MFGWFAATSDADAVADMTEHSLRLNPDNTISTIRPENIHTSPADVHISVSLFRKNIVVTISHNGRRRLYSAEDVEYAGDDAFDDADDYGDGNSDMMD